MHDGQIAAIHDMNVECARLCDQIAELRVELGRAAGDIQRRHARAAQVLQDLVDDLARHGLRARRPGIDVAMDTALIATIAEIDLQHFHGIARNRGELGLLEQGQRSVHRHS